VNIMAEPKKQTKKQSVKKQEPKQPESKVQENKSQEPIPQELKKQKGPKTLLGIFEIIPDMENDIDLDELMEKKVKPAVEKAEGYVETYSIETVAFGAKKIIARIILKEREGGTQPIEDAIMGVSDIMRTECSMISIIS
jgi:elongation factor 1-beta